MSRTTLLALAAAAALVGCPLPQPLPEYSPIANTPPRIVMDDSVPGNQIPYSGTIVPVPAGCTGAKPAFPLHAQIRDSNTTEPIEVRWFVNYDPSNSGLWYWKSQETIQAVVPTPPDATLREIRGWTFLPYDFPSVAGAAADAVGALHIVELVVSNGFYSPALDAPLPFRSPAPGFEVQVYRWVFMNVAPLASGSCPADDALCAVCPT